MVKPWSLYVLRCCDASFYTGITNNLDRRLTVHNSGKGAKYTRARLPVEIVASLEVGTRSTALKLEYRFKKLSRAKKKVYIETGLAQFVELQDI